MKSKRITIIAVITIMLLSACSTFVVAENNSDSIDNEASSTVSSLSEQLISDDIDLENLFFPFWESWEILHDHFYSQPLEDELMVSGAIKGMLRLIEQEGVVFDQIPELEDIDAIESIAIRAGTPRNAEEIFLPFWRYFVAALNSESEHGFTSEELMQSSLHGMVNSLGDPHTSYIDPNQYLQINIPLDGEYEGIGAWVDTSEEYLTIVSPMTGSPAEDAGLKPKDQVVAVDGEDMTGIDGDLVIRKVIGPAGSTVTLTIRREGVAQDFDVEIIRALIVLPTLESQMETDKIGYIRLYNFGQNAAIDFKAAIQDLLDQGAEALIIDLRNNGGGFLHISISITSEFFEDGIVLYEEYADGARDVNEVESGGIAIDIPIIVLINGGSASASEILAGAIQDRDRGLLVGTTSFGKGSVQLPFVLTDNRGGLRVTIARWLTPNERLIHNVGLTPDVIVEFTDEDIEAEIDTQLEKAIELLLSELN